uniref:Uncharacterized protein n=1 Tax=Tanacetum cinerariifolium TaxID=118510 RepID=A0A6L2NYB4_TANCI|nr:hypothetical protein [Tanacetum cinerariifolium]
MGDENPIRTLGDYSKPSNEGYKNNIELPVWNNVRKERKNNIYDVATGDDGKETDGPNMEVSVKEAEKKNRAKNKAKNMPIKEPEKEVVESISSQLVEYYLKHKINENLTEGLVDNNRFNDSLLGAWVGKKKGKTYNVLPRGTVYDVILKKKDKKEGGH